MIKLFVKKTLDETICSNYTDKLISASMSHELKITDNSVCRVLQENNPSNSKLKRTITNLLFESKFLKTQIQKKGFDQRMIKYLLEPDDNYLNNVVHKPYE
ncbi:hypothetical protein DF185_05715 [Marinifilum breve]|uniref:Uncharacterized protein n=1 Tax=Marinifilum breve TaxID=2184082 RepID=A0A2V4A0Q3_9BACT|nr:hypothetical protein DF185_05715 [Marinifilum breve]